MFCPRCRVEFRPGFTKCSDCHVRLVPDLPPERKPIEYATVWESGNPATIAVAKSVLRSAGIEYYTMGEQLQDIIGGGRLGGFNPVTGPVRIRVRAEDEAEAGELLRGLREIPGGAGSVEAPEEDAEVLPEESQPDQAAQTARSPWRALGLMAQVLVLGLVIAGFFQRHRAGTAGWSHGDLAIRYVDRSLDLEAALAPHPPVIRWLLQPWGRPSEDTGTWAARIYGKALHFLDAQSHPEFRAQAAMVRAHLAVTLAHFGQRDAAAAALRPLAASSSKEWMQAIAARVSRAYGLEVTTREADARTGELPPGWTADTLDARWAETVGDPSTAPAARDRITARGHKALQWAMASEAVYLTVVFAGLVLLLRLAFRRPVLPPLRTPWTLRAGLWTVVLAEFWIFAAGFAVGILGLPQALWRVAWAFLIFPLPWLLLVRRRLLRPTGVSAPAAFGLGGWRGRVMALAVWIMATYAASAAGGDVIAYFAQHHANDEWYLSESMVLGSRFEVAVSGSGSVVIGPVVEEVAFRAVLYGSLRNCLAPLPAAALSSVAFAATHPYGLPSLLGVAWTGLVFCFAYERTRSLVPSIGAHMLVNAFWVLDTLMTFR